MSVRLWTSRARRAFLATGTAFVLAGGVGVGVGTASVAQAADVQGPCDIYAAGGTPCVAAHSTTRALYGAYDGPLYQVQRASDSTTKDIGVISPGGYANAAAQDAFCANTTCVITEIYDQSGKGNHLTRALKGSGWSGPAAGGNDNLSNATAAPALVNGHKVYGVYIAPGDGYRNNNTTGIATGDDPEGMYAVLDGTHYNGGCCFDYGNAETSASDTGNGHMEAIYFGNSTTWGSGAGKGPWIMSDQENNLISGANVGNNATDPSIADRFVTAMVKGGPNQWALRGGDAQSGALSTYYSGPRVSEAGYSPMHKEGSIILGIGGDNSNGSAGTFYEGVMTSGYPTDATENAVQANINTVSYTAIPVPLAAGKLVSLQLAASGSTPQYVKHDDADDLVSVAGVTAGSASEAQDATWVETPGLNNPTCVSFESVDQPGSYLRHYAFQFHLQPNDGGAQFAQDATFCPQSGNSGQGTSFQSVNYTTRYLRAYNGKLDLASNGGSNAWDNTTNWASDSSWSVGTPLAGLTAPLISSPADGSTTGTTPAITGTGAAGTTVTVTDEVNDVLCTATVATDGSWSCTPAEALATGKHTLSAVGNDTGGEVSQASNAVTVLVASGSTSSSSEQIQTTVTQQGGLTISVDNASPVVLPTPTLTGDASMLTSSGDMNPVTVTDTRTQSPGWNVVGQVTDFSNGAGGTIAAGQLGWAPKVVDSATGETVTPGAAVAPGANGGLGTAQQLASAAAGSSRGTAHVGATLNLLAPTSTQLGTYTATLTLTAI